MSGNKPSSRSRSKADTNSNALVSPQVKKVDCARAIPWKTAKNKDDLINVHKKTLLQPQKTNTINKPNYEEHLKEPLNDRTGTNILKSGITKTRSPTSKNSKSETKANAKEAPNVQVQEGEDPVSPQGKGTKTTKSAADAAFERLKKGPSKADGPGYIYVYKLRSDNTMYKIGMTEKLPSRRVHFQETHNKEEYQLIFSITCAWRKLTEKVAHLWLQPFHSPRQVADGGSEWFKGDRIQFIDIIKRVRLLILDLYDGPEPSYSLA